ncbi:addiction module toxin, HicA family [Sphingomonas sp. ABOLD]|uniref:Putative RNA binding protein YcfA (HicA-like mRNA interferase family) n=1 Tax=Sphingomonas trueperi TaxID=53317 RepID=A0A7X6BF43_9SPHN|nr:MULTISPECIES: type II toxin-antitoxin system HicA family toxin [Sphingomonas]NJB99452.1 putative RNA binding protein YcfA (HicA-like mRNA interferase family) [Sphingomonas trueperi]RSV35163.1 addiction module toxin, HicA family [Sphingomonas sp. ABOLE]RSV40943.1 addiction module toxin, HicA family [Sphingomonas sp. ABOLD]
MKSREVIKLIEADGWYEVRQTGSHKHFRHPTKPGLATVPHPKSHLPKGTLNSITKQTGVPLNK